MSPFGLILTAEFDADEVLNAQVLQEHARGGSGLKQEGDVCAQLRLDCGEMEVRRFLVEERSVPEVLWQTKELKIKIKIETWMN